jgi:hypothetical protein
VVTSSGLSKTVLLDQTGGELHFNQKFLQFAAYYGFVPRVCRPYRPETKGKIESTVRFVKQNFWPGISFGSLPDLNQQARAWMLTTTPVTWKIDRKGHLLSYAHSGVLAGDPYRGSHSIANETAVRA